MDTTQHSAKRRLLIRSDLRADGVAMHGLGFRVVLDSHNAITIKQQWFEDGEIYPGMRLAPCLVLGIEGLGG